MTDHEKSRAMIARAKARLAAAEVIPRTPEEEAELQKIRDHLRARFESSMIPLKRPPKD